MAILSTTAVISATPGVPELMVKTAFPLASVITPASCTDPTVVERRTVLLERPRPSSFRTKTVISAVSVLSAATSSGHAKTRDLSEAMISVLARVTLVSWSLKRINDINIVKARKNNIIMPNSFLSISISIVAEIRIRQGVTVQQSHTP